MKAENKIPQRVWDTLPKDMVVLGYGGNFVVPERSFEGIAFGGIKEDWEKSNNYHGTLDNTVYAAPETSEIVRVNREKNLLPENPNNKTNNMKEFKIPHYNNENLFRAIKIKLSELGYVFRPCEYVSQAHPEFVKVCKDKVFLRRRDKYGLGVPRISLDEFFRMKKSKPIPEIDGVKGSLIPEGLYFDCPGGKDFVIDYKSAEKMVALFGMNREIKGINIEGILLSNTKIKEIYDFLLDNNAVGLQRLVG